MISVSIRILPPRGTGGGCNWIELKAVKNGGTWETLEGSWKTWRALRKLVGTKNWGAANMEGLAYHGSFAKQKMQERLGNIAWADLFFCGCKTFFVGADMYMSLQSKSWKTNSKGSSFLRLGYFFSADDKRPISLLCGETDKSRAEKTDFLLCTPADPFVRSAALQWVDRQTDREPTYQPCHLPILKPTTFGYPASPHHDRPWAQLKVSFRDVSGECYRVVEAEQHGCPPSASGLRSKLTVASLPPSLPRVCHCGGAT